MAHPALTEFTDRMDHLVAIESNPNAIVEATMAHLPNLLARPDFLEERHRKGSETAYRQHIVHVHPDGLYSVVALVWLPGQATPIHDHRSWCVVGVVQGREQETRYHLYVDDARDERFLLGRGSSIYRPGEVCGLVPPEEDIHVVENTGTGTGVSIHIYGADISEVGSSINHIFDQPVLTSVPEGARRLSWREFDQAPSLR